jgi:hypothetical protein
MNRSPIHWRPLLALTAAVLAVHVLVLQPQPRMFQQFRESRPRALITRTVVSQAPPAVAPAAPPEPVITPAARARSVLAPAEEAPRRTDLPLAARAAGLVAAVAAVPVGSAAKTPAASTPAASTPAVSQSLAFAVPKSVLLHYEVTAHTRGLVLNARGQLRWRQDGNEYEAKLELLGGLFPNRTQESTGRITVEGLAPQRFSDKARSEEAAHFQRDEGKVSFSSNRPDAPLLPGAQDRLSVMLQLGAMIAGNPKNFGPASTISIQTASTRDAEVWHFTVEGEETLQLPGGELKTLKLIRNPRKEFDQKIELWLAPGMDYVPVRLRLTQPNGDWVDQQWSSTDKG